MSYATLVGSRPQIRCVESLLIAVYILWADLDFARVRAHAIGAAYSEQIAFII